MDTNSTGTTYPRHRALSGRSNTRRDGPQPEAVVEFCDRLIAELQIRHLLRLHGYLIRMRVFLRSKVPPVAGADIAEAFRNAGFVVESDGDARLTVTGEACLALTFMVRAAGAGVLSDAFEVQLGEILDDATPLRMERHEVALKGLDPMMGSIASIDLPRAAG